MREEHRKLSLEAPGAGSIPRGICATGGEDMTDYLPEIYQHFERRYPAVKEAFDALGAAEHEAGPLADKERRLIKLGIAVGAESEGGVRSHVRKLLGVGASEEEILHTIVLALTTIGFPATNAALSWAEEVLAEEANGK
jgi:4-carboxymuconolactone decarboxylase